MLHKQPHAQSLFKSGLLLLAFLLTGAFISLIISEGLMKVLPTWGLMDVVSLDYYQKRDEIMMILYLAYIIIAGVVHYEYKNHVFNRKSKDSYVKHLEKRQYVDNP